MSRYFYVLLVETIVLALVISGKLEDDYYKTVALTDGAYCFTLLNGTHQFGCTCKRC